MGERRGGSVGEDPEEGRGSGAGGGAGWSCIGRGGIGEEWRGGAQEPNIIQHSIAEISRLKQKSYSAAESGWRSLGHVLHCAQREGCVNHVTDFKMAHMRDESRRMQRQT